MRPALENTAGPTDGPIARAVTPALGLSASGSGASGSTATPAPGSKPAAEGAGGTVEPAVRPEPERSGTRSPTPATSPPVQRMDTATAPPATIGEGVSEGGYTPGTPTLGELTISDPLPQTLEVSAEDEARLLGPDSAGPSSSARDPPKVPTQVPKGGGKKKTHKAKR